MELQSLYSSLKQWDSDVIHSICFYVRWEGPFPWKHILYLLILEIRETESQRREISCSRSDSVTVEQMNLLLQAQVLHLWLLWRFINNNPSTEYRALHILDLKKKKKPLISTTITMMVVIHLVPVSFNLVHWFTSQYSVFCTVMAQHQPLNRTRLHTVNHASHLSWVSDLWCQPGISPWHRHSKVNMNVTEFWFLH